MASETLIPVTVPAAGSLGLALGLFLHGMFSPSSRLLGPIVVHGPRDSGRVALTFDDGPTDGTGLALDALRTAACRATFFFIGRNVQSRPELVRRATAEGHLIANHSFDHNRQGVWRRQWYWEEQLRQTDAAIAEASGPGACRFFRPPLGFKSWRMAEAARRTGHLIVTWSVRGMDGVPTTPEEILARILPRARGGDIIVLHDGVEPSKQRDPSATVRAIPDLVKGLRRKGLEPVRLDELLGEVSAAPKAPAAGRA